MRRGPHKGSRGRRERFTFPETQGPCPGAAPTAPPVESDLPGLPHEPQLLQEFELVVETWLSEISPPSTLYTTHPRSSIRFSVGGTTPSLSGPSNVGRSHGAAALCAFP